MTAEKLDSTKLKCSHCHRQFKYESERQRHELSHSPQFQCGVCSKKFSYISALRRHEKQHVRTGTVECYRCGGKFRDEILLKRHMNYAHKGTFSCKKCSSSFNSEVALQTHVKIHRPQAERQFRCRFNGCNKTFNFPHHLKHHELAHTNAKQHFCNVCDKGFIQLHHLKTHIKTHDPENWFSCEMTNCNKKFATQYAIKRHLATHKKKLDDFNYKARPHRNASVKSKSVVKDVVHNKRKDVHSISKNDQNANESKKFPQLSSPLFERKMSNKEIITDMEVITDCKTVLGGCLSNDLKGNDCLCAQMTHNDNEAYDLTPIEKKSSEQTDNKFDKNQNSCEGCESVSLCNNNMVVDKKAYIVPYKDEIFPNIEYRDNGIVKLRDTFDIDISRNIVSKQNESGNVSKMKLEPYNSCKDILGKCIVSGNGTISENCLCARMMHFDDMQMLAEEVQDIIPQPKDPNLGSFVI